MCECIGGHVYERVCIIMCGRERVSVSMGMCVGDVCGCMCMCGNVRE